MPADDRQPERGSQGQVRIFDAETLRDFIDLLGPAKARDWLEAFGLDLAAEFAEPDEGLQSADKSRANIHHSCARAGLIGFEALHHACLEFLETRTEHGDVQAAYHRVRVQAELAYPEIERQRALLI